MPVRKVFPTYPTQGEAIRKLSEAINSIIDDLPVRVSRAVSSAATADINAGVYLADATSAAFTVTLPSVAAYKYRQLTIKKVDSSANAVTVDGNGSETIDGATTYALSAQYDSVTIYSDGSEWHVIATA